MKDFEEDFNDTQVSEKRTGKSLVALMIAIILFIGSLQGYFYLIHPQPRNIPALNEVEKLIDQPDGEDFTLHGSKDIVEVVNNNQDQLKKIANFIASRSCPEPDLVCQTQAIFYFVRDAVEYVPDPQFHDKLENPLWVLKTGGADCEDMAVLLAGLQKSIGNKARVVFVPGHAYAQVSVKNYKGEKWINLEATCDECQFGELPNDTALQRKEYIEI